MVNKALKKKKKPKNLVHKHLYQFNKPKVEESGKVYKRKDKHKREEEVEHD
jgi:hypothetical protein